MGLHLQVPPIGETMSEGIRAFYDERNDTLTLTIGSQTHTLYASQAWGLLDQLQMELDLAGKVADRKGD